MKTGLVLEGGAMRGMFTCGVLDVFMEHGIRVDGAVGVSAGAVFGCNYKSLQHGRPIRYNKKYCQDPNYASFRNLFRTGNLFGEEFCYHTIPFELDPWDAETFRKNPMEFYVVATEVLTGEPVYHKCDAGLEEDIRWFQASASMPLVSKMVEIGDRKYLDGGVADSIPLYFMRSKGYRKNIVILTQPADYRKKKNKLMPLIRASLPGYPALVKAMANRHLQYNRTLRYIALREKKGDTFVIRPAGPLHIGHMEKDPKELERVYQLGRRAAEECMQALRDWMES